MYSKYLILYSMQGISQSSLASTFSINICFRLIIFFFASFYSFKYTSWVLSCLPPACSLCSSRTPLPTRASTVCASSVLLSLSRTLNVTFCFASSYWIAETLEKKK